MNKLVIIFSGFNDRAVVSFLRTLQLNDVRYAIIAKSADDEIFLTKYASNVLETRAKRELDLKDISHCIKAVQEKSPADQYMIAPSTEALNRFLLDNSDFFNRLNCEVPLVNKELYEKVSDKYTFNNLCKEEKILTPARIENLADVLYPVVAKPKTYFSQNREILTPTLIFDKADLDLFKEKRDHQNFFYQEFIYGQSYYLLYYFYKNGEVVKLSQQNYLQQPHGKSILAAETSGFHESDESLKYEQLLKSVNFFGLIMIEVINTGDKTYMIEANPRFWGPSQLFVDAGFNLFNAFLYENGLLTQKPDYSEPAKISKYFWFGGITEVLAKEQKLTYHNYSPVELVDNLEEWLKADIYKRDDTKEVFIKQTGF